MVVSSHSRMSPFEGLEVTRKKSEDKDFCCFPDGKLKLVFCSRVSGILNNINKEWKLCERAAMPEQQVYKHNLLVQVSAACRDKEEA